MRKFLIGFGITAGLLLCLTAAAVLMIRSGPTAPVPTQDPILRLNSERANLDDNAAELYTAAHERLRGEPKTEWTTRTQWRFGDPVPEDVAEWVEQNAEPFEVVARAAQMSHCWSPLQRDASGTVLLSRDMTAMRILAKLCYARARVAAAEHDLHAFAESIEVIDRIGRHAFQTPHVLPHLIGVACLSLAQDGILAPFEWPWLSAQDRAWYAQRVEACFQPPPLTAALASEEELSAWMYIIEQQRTPALGIVVPPARVAGELRRYLAPAHELAAQPVEQQADPRNTLRQQIDASAQEHVPWFRPARMLAHLLTGSLARVIDLQIRMVVTQRGLRTVVELFELRDHAGQFPASLDALEGEFKIDPYTSQPFIYRLTDDGFTLYSAGLDRDDDGGKHHAKFGEQRSTTTQPAPPPDGDYVFWPIPTPEQD